MKISFFGAAGEVTGSCTLIETGQTKFLVDCGIFQGEAFSDQRNRNKFPFLVSEIDFVLLTHAHLDHCGRLPKLAKEAFKGSVYCTAATADFAEIMLLDSERVIAEEAQKLNQPPLYSQADVLKITKNLSPLEYGQEVKINQDIKIRCRDAGHILGSAIFEIWIKEDGQEKKLVFSGDLGNPPAPIVKDTELIDEADLVFVESTYGGIIHEPADERISKLRSAIIESAGQGGVLMIPAFALERTQEVLYELNELVENKEIPAMPIFVDSPLAIKATAVYKKYVEMYDDESKRLIASGDDLFNFPGLKYTPTVSDSKGINDVPGAKVILAGSGMCNGGRIPHHLKRYLSHKQNHLLIISYQAEGCLGRQLLDGAKKVLIEGEEVIVRAKVSAIGAYSSHADQPKLINWLKGFSKTKPKKVFIMHGEKQNSQALALLAKEDLGLETELVEYNKILEF